MRVTGGVRAIIRTYDAALHDLRTTHAIWARFGIGPPEWQPANAQLFSVSSTQDIISFREYAKKYIGYDYRYDGREVNVRLNPRLVIDRHEGSELAKFVVHNVFDPQVMLHRYTYSKVQESIANPVHIAHGSQAALKRILEAIKKKNLSSLSPLMLDSSILPEIASKSNLSSLTKRQLSCLDITDEDLVGVDGIIDRWNKIDLPEDNPSGLLSSLKIGKNEKNEPILTYTVDMLAILRKKLIVRLMGSLPPPKKGFARAAPAAYGLPSMRIICASLEFAHKGTGTKGTFSDEPFLRNFHVHSI